MALSSFSGAMDVPLSELQILYVSF